MNERQVPENGAETLAASPWIRRFAGQVPPGRVLDIAAGGGRHSRLFLDLGHPVLALDRDIAALVSLAGCPDFEAREVDLEATRDPLPTEKFAAVVVANYLYRPLMPPLVRAVGPGGWLLYETFAVGNERYGKPRNPAFLLEPGELIEAVRGRLEIVAYENLTESSPRPAVRQRIAARRKATAAPE